MGYRYNLFKIVPFSDSKEANPNRKSSLGSSAKVFMLTKQNCCQRCSVNARNRVISPPFFSWPISRLLNATMLVFFLRFWVFYSEVCARTFQWPFLYCQFVIIVHNLYAFKNVPQLSRFTSLISKKMSLGISSLLS